jgi:hypothetical protein
MGCTDVPGPVCQPSYRIEQIKELEAAIGVGGRNRRRRGWGNQVDLALS